MAGTANPPHGLCVIYRREGVGPGSSFIQKLLEMSRQHQPPRTPLVLKAAAAWTAGAAALLLAVLLAPGAARVIPAGAPPMSASVAKATAWAALF